MKVSVNPPTKDHTLQLLMYLIMRIKSDHKEEFIRLQKIGIFNPRLNTVYSLSVDKIPGEVIQEV